tara:strand:- start:3069 stop:4406 length:1338 start_codon:yes stop_codon:yes gene_type:complete
MAEEKKVDTSIIDNEMKKEAITGKSDKTYGKFNNKYTKGILLAIISAAVAKNDPYLLKGVEEKLSEFDKADRAAREKFIESATTAATTEIARNKLKRIQRREKISPSIEQAIANGLDPVLAGNAYKKGYLPTMMKLKLKDSTLDLNTLFKVTEENKSNMGKYSSTDILESLAGPTLKLDQDFSNLNAPKRYNPISNFLGSSDDATQEISNRVASQNVSSDDYTNINVDGYNLSELGQKAIASGQKVRNITVSKIKSDYTQVLSNTLGVDSSISQGEFVFDSDDKINESYGLKIAGIMSAETENLISGKGVSWSKERYLSPSNAQKLVLDRYFKTVKGKGVVINKEVVGPNGLGILPAGWTPAKSGGTNTGSSGAGSSGGSGTTSLSTAKILTNWNTIRDKLKKLDDGTMLGKKRYRQALKLQGVAIQKQYKVLGGDPDDISILPN